MSKLKSQIEGKDKLSLPFRKNRDENLLLIEKMTAAEDQIKAGGGQSAIEKQHAKDRLTARERINILIDKGSEFFELGVFTGFGMYEEWGGAPAGGVITGIGYVSSHLSMIIANDATVKAGAFFPITCKKVIRAQKIAMGCCIPLIYLVDSAGVFLPLQDEVFPDEDDFGRIFRNNAIISAMGIPQIAAIMGSCVAGGAYLPVMCDVLIMTEGSGLYLAGPALVKAAIGQNITSEELGGTEMHASISGTVDYKEKSDRNAIERIREIMDKQGHTTTRSNFSKIDSKDPIENPDDILGIIPHDGQGQYDIMEILLRIIDEGEFTEYRPTYGKTVICGTARIGGFAVGIVANQKTLIKSKGKPIEIGGVIYTESANKASRFILDCNQQIIPILFFHDVNGFMVGREAEASGIIRAGAKMVNAVSNSTVPKITIIIGGSFGAGHYAMCGKAYDPRFIFAWPTARYSVMGGDQAANTLLDIRIAQLKKEGQTLTDDKKKKLLEEIKDRYTKATDPKYAAARLWIDAIIKPQKTREALIWAINACSTSKVDPPIKLGVFQT